jgi:hypothetical protein
MRLTKKEGGGQSGKSRASTRITLRSSIKKLGLCTMRLNLLEDLSLTRQIYPLKSGTGRRMILISMNHT